MAKRCFLFFLVFIPFFLWSLFSLAKNFKTQKEEAVFSLIQESNIAASGYAYKILKTQELLKGITLLSSVKNGDKKSCNENISSIMKKLQDNIYTGIAVADAQGNFWCSNLPISEGGVNIADRHYFQRALETNMFSVGEYQTGRLSGFAGVPFAYPFMSDGGELKGVVVGQIATHELDKFFVVPEKTYNEDRVYMLLDGDGVLLARLPTNPELVGKSLELIGGESLFGLLQKKISLGFSEGYFESVGLVGTKRIFAFSKILPKGVELKGELYLLIGVKKSDLYADGYAAFLRELYSFAALFLVSVIIFFIVRNRFVNEKK